MSLSRRAALAAPLAVAAIPTVAASHAVANPDAEMIDFVEEFLRVHAAKEAEAKYLCDKPSSEWNAEDRALWESSTAWNTGYHEDLDEIAEWEPASREGLAAQAKAALWHFRYDNGDKESLVRGLAVGVLRLVGEPIPTWADRVAQEDAA